MERGGGDEVELGPRAPIALTVAGSDSGGGAGIQADLKTFASLEVYGLSAIAAVTAQSTVEVRRVHPIPPEHVRDQIETMLEDFPVRIVKTGMLCLRETVIAVARIIETRALAAVVDPVMTSESGAELAGEGAVVAMERDLLPVAAIFTPNLPEVGVLLGRVPRDVSEMIDAGFALAERGAEAVLVKGGHLEGAPTDVLVLRRSRRVVRLEGERIDTRSTHGTGCTYSAAIAAFLSRGLPVEDAVQRAHRYVREAIAAAPSRPHFGRGRGPLHHFHPHYRWPRAPRE